MISLQRISFYCKESDCLISIEYEGGIEGDRVHLSVPFFEEAILDNKHTGNITPPIAYNDSEESLASNILLRENTEYFFSVSIPGEIIYEVNNIFPFNNIKLGGFIRRLNKKQWKVERFSPEHVQTTISGYLNFKNFVGIVDLSVGKHNYLFVEVASSKIDYLTDFQTILDDLSSSTVDLIFQAAAVSGVSIKQDYDVEPNDLTRYFHLRYLFYEDRLPSAVESILNNMKSIMIEYDLKIEIGRLRNPNLRKIIVGAPHLDYDTGGALANVFHGFTPRQLFETYKYETLDTPENRFIKYYLEYIEFLILNLLDKVNNNISASNQKGFFWNVILQELQNWQISIDDWLTNPMWKNIGRMTFMPSNSQVLQKREGYRDVLQFQQRLETGFQINWNPLGLDEVIGDIRPIFDLYEIWCFFKLKSVIDGLYGNPLKEHTNLWVINDANISVNLKRGTPSAVRYKFSIEEIEGFITLYYNTKFRNGQDSGSYSINFQPDYTIKIELNTQHYFLHFDAKYRLTYIDDETDDAEDINQTTTSKRDDLVKMHSYKDAIRSSLGAYTLYPGERTMIFSENDTYIIPSIGAFPMRPSHEDNDMRELSSFINKAIYQISKPS